MLLKSPAFYLLGSCLTIIFLLFFKKNIWIIFDNSSLFLSFCTACSKLSLILIKFVKGSRLAI